MQVVGLEKEGRGERVHYWVLTDVTLYTFYSSKDCVNNGRQTRDSRNLTTGLLETRLEPRVRKAEGILMI